MMRKTEAATVPQPTSSSASSSSIPSSEAVTQLHVGTKRKRGAAEAGLSANVVHHLFCTQRVDVGAPTAVSINPLFCKPTYLGIRAAGESPIAAIATAGGGAGQPQQGRPQLSVTRPPRPPKAQRRSK
jgi:hypothetical protein